MNLDIPVILTQYICLLFSLCVHEAAHAWMANRCGDPSARLLGRLTLNPAKHIDPIGTVVMPLIMMVSGLPYLFGWAKPVPFNPLNLKNIRRDPVLIAVAGPASNLLIAVACALFLRILIVLSNAGLDLPLMEPILHGIFALVAINLVLILFNLIPVPPLDGHYVLYYFLPRRGQETLERIGPFGIIIAIFVARPWFAATMPHMESFIYWIATVGLG